MMPRKRSAEGTPGKMAQGGEVKFPFRLDCERAYAAWSEQARPPAVTAKYDDPDDRADQRPYDRHRKVGAPRVPAKGGQGSTVVSSDKDDSDANEIVRMGATKPAVLQALAATKDGHGVKLACINKEDPDDNKSMSVGARKLAWLQAAAAAAKLNSGVSGTP
jgi:hypothetical protein